MYPCCTLLGPKELKFIALAKHDLLTNIDQTCTLSLEKQPKHAHSVHSTPNPSPPEDEEALTLVRCRETSLRGKRDPCSFWTWMKTLSHWFWAVHPKLWNGSVRCLLTRNRQHIFALAEVVSALPVFLDLIWPCILHCLYSCTNGCSSKRNRSCTEIPAQNQPLCLVLFCGPSLVGSRSWQVFISKLVHDLAFPAISWQCQPHDWGLHCLFSASKRSFSSCSSSARSASWNFSNSDCSGKDHLLRLWPVAFVLLPWSLQWLPVPKKTNLANGVSMDLEYSNCEISRMEETNRAVRFDPIASLPRAPASGSCRRRVENSEVDCWIFETTRRHKLSIHYGFSHVQTLCIFDSFIIYAKIQ